MTLAEPSTLLLIGATFVVAGFVKGVVGLGLPIVVLSILTPTIGLKPALALFIIPGVVMNVWQALVGPAFNANLQRFWTFWACAVIGILAGTALLARIDQNLAALVYGVMLGTYAVARLANYGLTIPTQRERWLNPSIGGISGVLFGATGQFMVPGILYVEALGLKRDVFVQALGMTFLTITATLGIGLVANDLMTTELATLSTLAILPAVAGLTVGTRLRHKLSENLFRRILFLWLLVTAVVIIWRSLSSVL